MGSSLQHEIKRCLFLGKKAMTNLDSMFKKHFADKVHIFKAMVFSAVMHGYESLTIKTIVDELMFMLFNMLSRFVIAFLPNSKHLLISWFQTPSTVILEPKNIKSVTVSIVPPSICHEVMGLDAMISVF